MDNGNSSSVLYRNPFDDGSFEGQDAQLCSEEVFDMSADHLQQELDEENKLILEASESKPDFSSLSSVPSLSSLSGGSDTMLLNKLGVTQYLAYKSEPLGELGPPLTPTKRPWFGNTILSPRREVPEDVNQKGEETTDSINGLNLEPSWLKNHSLSLLSESEHIEIPGGSKENSQDWLTGLPASNNCSENISFSFKPKNSNLTYSKDLSYMISNKTSALPSAASISYDASKSSANISQTDCPLARSNDLGTCPDNARNSAAEDVLTPANANNTSLIKTHSANDDEKSAVGCNPSAQDLKSGLSSAGQSTTKESLLKSRGSVDEVSYSCEREKMESFEKEEMSHSGKSRFQMNDESPLRDSMAPPGQTQKTSLTGISFEKSPDAAVNQSRSIPALTTKKAEETLPDIPAPARDFADEAELPSLYWRSAFPADCSSKAEVQSCSEPEPPIASSCSYVVGTVEPAMACSPNLCRSASPSSQSDASTVRANPSQFCVNSVLTDEPQLSSTREISDDDESTPRVKTAERNAKRIDTSKESPNSDGIGIESILKLFANTTSLPTPCLMDRVRNYISERQRNDANHKGEPDHGEISSGLGESHFGGESSSCSSEPSDRDTPEIPVLKKPVTFKPFPRHLSLPAHSTQLAPALRTRPPARPAVVSEKEEFAHVTATVMKKKKAPASGNDVAAPRAEERLRNAPAVKCNKSQIFFGGVNLRDTFERLETLTLRNSSFGEMLDLELRIEESSPFKIGSLEKNMPVSKCLQKFGPREENTITVSFLPNFAGVFEAKLNLYPRGDQFKRIKYTVDLFGYAGESRIVPLHQSDAIHPQLNGSSLKSSLTLANHGTAAGFALISILNDDGTALKCSRLLVVPECFTLNPKETREVQLLIDFPCAMDARPFNLIVTSGDEILRQRWTRALMDGAEWKNPSGLELTKLVQLGSASCAASTALQEVEIFKRNMKTQKIRFSPEVSADDSDFVTLKAESTSTSLLQTQLADKTNTALDTLLSQRRLTSTINIKKNTTDKNGRVCLGTSEIGFPATRVGAVSTQKIPLQNWSQTTEEIRIVKITGPFSVRHLRSAIPAGFYTKLPILFHPVKPGTHDGTVLLEVGTHNYPLTVKVHGEAV